MKALSQFELTITSAALLAACGGSQPPIGAPGATPQSRAIATRTERGGSWMLPQAKSADLLYVANGSDVIVFSYPAGKVIGTLKGFDANTGECVDAARDIYIGNYKPVSFDEYAHGGTKRIGRLNLKGTGPGACAVDPTTGDVAVVGGSPSVDIFERGKPEPTVVKVRLLVYAQSVAYDGKGNLFVDGLKTFSKGQLVLAMLPKGGDHFLEVTVDHPFNSESTLQWNGDDLLAEAYVPAGHRKLKPILARYSVNGAKANRIGVLQLSTTYLVLQFLVQGKTLVISNWPKGPQQREVLFDKYPHGGVPTMVLTKDLTNPRGVAVSLAPH
jgi:hypothetical protein